MKGEPKWGNRGILQLNWVFGEYFVRPEVWRNVFKCHGIGCGSVMNTKGVELRTVVQLASEEEVGIVTEGLASDPCAKCERVKYLPITRGLFPATVEEPSHAVTRTREYFGSGGGADRRVLVSQEIARALASQKIRGASLWPVQANGHDSTWLQMPRRSRREAPTPEVRRKVEREHTLDEEETQGDEGCPDRGGNDAASARRSSIVNRAGFIIRRHENFTPDDATS